MRQLSVYFLFLLCSTIWLSCDDEELFVGANTLATEERFVAVFSGLRIADDMQATVTFGDEVEVLLTANDNLLDRIRTEVNGGILEVSLLRGNYRDVDISLAITLPDLSYLKATDDAEITAGTFLDLDELQLEASDDAKISVMGTVATLNLRSTDGAAINVFDLLATNCDAQVSDGADAETTVQNNLSGRVTDGGDLFYRGNPTIDVSISDGGELIDAN
ncbi:MAG: head GIN domain-containing protein [Bacteroidota bacterium]